MPFYATYLLLYLSAIGCASLVATDLYAVDQAVTRGSVLQSALVPGGSR